jgi:hypothetical protein
MDLDRVGWRQSGKLVEAGAKDIEGRIYVVGFPKSGNTWLLRLLCDACDANIDQGDAINAADFVPGRRNLLHKVHFADPNVLKKQGKVVYVVRDVRDVLVSGFFHNHRYIAEGGVLAEGPSNLKRALLRRYFRHHIRRLNGRWCGTEWRQSVNFFSRMKARLTGQEVRRQRGTNWSDHVLAWISLPEVCVVRYEDLLNDPGKQLARVLAHLGLEVSGDALASIVRRQSFENKKRSFRENGDRGNELFMRKGRAGDWTRFLDAELAREIVTRNEEGLRAMKYLSSP